MKKKSWSDYYTTEEELIEATKAINANEHQMPYLVPKGYVYIQSFQTRLRRGQGLTEKQMTQLKRIAYEIADKLKAQRKEAIKKAMVNQTK